MTDDDNQQFFREVLGAPVGPTIEQVQLSALAEKYVRDTEEFDRKVCTGGMLHGQAMPRTPEERRAITENARQAREFAELEARRLGFTAKEFRQVCREQERRIYG